MRGEVSGGTARGAARRVRPGRSRGAPRRALVRPTTPPSTASTTSARSSSRSTSSRPCSTTPPLFGAIAATNALNDVFAMGGRPLVALSVAAFPEELPSKTVRAILDGAAAKVAEAGALLAGGHTIRDDEPKYGLAVVGTVHPDAIWRKSTARPGDALFLTKPLGTGLVLTGARRGLLGQAELDAAIASMTELNAAAADAVRPFEPSAVTDVTGFGLFGHAHELAERSGVRVVLDGASFPALPGALAVAEQGVRTGGDERNREFVAAGALPERLARLRCAARLRPSDVGRAARLAPRREGARARGLVRRGRPVPRPDRTRRGGRRAWSSPRDRRGEAGTPARPRGLGARLSPGGGPRARRALPRGRHGSDGAADRLRARVRELAALR